MSFILCAHAGAWNTENAIAIETEQKAVQDAVALGMKEKNITDAVLQTVVFLENHPSLDAGTGSILQMDGIARTDAAIATNNSCYEKQYAGVLQLAGIKNPCLVAKKILDYQYHSVLSGEFAFLFAEEEGFEKSDLTTKPREDSYFHQCDFLNIPKNTVPTYSLLAQKGKLLDEKKLSTVGAVGVDLSSKTLVAVTSTGGLYYGYPGRVGDTGVFGHGIFCDKNVAVACTGEGDKMIQRMTASRVGFYYEITKNIQQSVEMAVEDLKNHQHGESGIIAVDILGNIGIAKSTTFLATAITN